MADHQASHRVHYGLIFVALCICTGLSVLFDLVSIQSKAVIIVLVLSIAVAKALFVMLYFMHLKFEGNWKYVLLAPTAILALGLPMALLPDIGLHYYDYNAPQVRYATGEPSADFGADAEPRAAEADGADAAASGH
jgi:cytochrome c oxidase subunit 4